MRAVVQKQSGERPLGLAALSLYDMARTIGPALFVIVIVPGFRAAASLLVDLVCNQPGQACKYAKHCNIKHDHQRLSASPPYEEHAFSLAEGGVFTRAGEGRFVNIFASPEPVTDGLPPRQYKRVRPPGKAVHDGGASPNYYICHELVIFGQ